MVISLKIGTRASKLARRQTVLFCDYLRNGCPHQNFEFQIIDITTSGDKHLATPLYDIGGKGLFCKELDEALLDGRIDIAVHSAKDLESKLHDNLTIACILPRANKNDILLSHLYPSFDSLPSGARVGTSSPRRKAQLLSLRPDLIIAPIRGKIETRLQKLKQNHNDNQNQFDAIILAVAGLERLDYLGNFQGEEFNNHLMLPSAGQGIIAAVTRRDAHDLHHMLYPLCHQPTLDALTAERALMRKLGGSCHSAIGVLCDIPPRNGNDQKRQMPSASKMIAQITHPEGKDYVRISMTGDSKNISDPEAMGTSVGQKLLEADSGKGRKLLKMIIR